MLNEKFIHNDPDAFSEKEISLHDCSADNITLEYNVLRFNFPEGFWISAQHPENKNEKVIRTGRSAADFKLKNVDDISVSVITRSLWRRQGNACIESWSIEQLVSAVNSGKCEIEFITQYRSGFDQLWHCVLHSKRRPYYRECKLRLPEAETLFRWNDLRPDREW